MVFKKGDEDYISAVPCKNLYNDTLFNGSYADFYEYELGLGTWLCPNTTSITIDYGTSFYAEILPCSSVVHIYNEYGLIPYV